MDTFDRPLQSLYSLLGPLLEYIPEIEKITLFSTILLTVLSLPVNFSHN